MQMTNVFLSSEVLYDIQFLKSVYVIEYSLDSMVPKILMKSKYLDRGFSKRER